MKRSYIALGSNLDNPKQQIKDAIDQIAALRDCTLVAQSSLYETLPMGFEEQDVFINAVVAVDTTLSALELLYALQGIETLHQRKRVIKNGPRTLDCDIVLYGHETLDSPELTLPHPGMLLRDFVLVPLLEIAPDARLPNREAIAPYLDQLQQRFCIQHS